MSNVAIITCIVGVISCVIGVATFTSAQLSKANQNGRILEKVDYTCRGVDEIKKEMKEKNHELDKVIDEHTVQITRLQQDVKQLKDINAQSRRNNNARN
jgi:hypothetical protein